MTRKKKDGRRNNGPDGPAKEAAKLVTGPADLFAAVEARAAEEKIPTAEGWRRAARAWLAAREVGSK